MLSNHELSGMLEREEQNGIQIKGVDTGLDWWGGIGD